jgi:hypothetical protein
MLQNKDNNCLEIVQKLDNIVFLPYFFPKRDTNFTNFHEALWVFVKNS